MKERGFEYAAISHENRLTNGFGAVCCSDFSSDYSFKKKLIPF
jgi:hypothetical protein